jgi:hypothetical protein
MISQWPGESPLCMENERILCLHVDTTTYLSLVSFNTDSQCNHVMQIQAVCLFTTKHYRISTEHLKFY